MLRLIVVVLVKRFDIYTKLMFRCLDLLYLITYFDIFYDMFGLTFKRITFERRSFKRIIFKRIIFY